MRPISPTLSAPRPTGTLNPFCFTPSKLCGWILANLSNTLVVRTDIGALYKLGRTLDQATVAAITYVQLHAMRRRS